MRLSGSGNYSGFVGKLNCPDCLGSAPVALDRSREVPQSPEGDFRRPLFSSSSARRGAFVQTSCPEVGLHTHIDWLRMRLVKPGVQFLQLFRRQRINGAFNALDCCQAHRVSTFQRGEDGQVSMRYLGLRGLSGAAFVTASRWIAMVGGGEE